MDRKIDILTDNEGNKIVFIFQTVLFLIKSVQDMEKRKCMLEV